MIESIVESVVTKPKEVLFALKGTPYTYEENQKLGSNPVLGTTVYRGANTLTNEVVAVKKIEKYRYEGAKERYISREINTLKSVRGVNEHVVQLYDIYEDDRAFYLIFEYCEQTLADIVMTSKDDYSPLSDLQCKDIFRQICLGYAWFRKNRILHRDLKPHNIFLKNGMVKIGDFGSTNSESVEQSGFIFTQQFSAPEQIRESVYDVGADIWALGIILHMMATGKHPFDTSDEDRVDVVENVLKKPLDINFLKSRDLDPECRDLIIRMLEKERKNRLTFEEVMSHPYVNILSSDDNESTPLADDDKRVELKDEEAKNDDCLCSFMHRTKVENISDEKEQLKYNELLHQHKAAIKKEYEDKVKRFISKINQLFTEAIILNTTVDLLSRCESLYEKKAKTTLFNNEELLEMLVLLIKLAITKRNKSYYHLNGYDSGFIFTISQISEIKQSKEFKEVKDATSKHLKRIDQNFTEVLNWMGRLKKKSPEKVPVELEKIAEAGMENLHFEISLLIRLSNCLKKCTIKLDKAYIDQGSELFDHTSEVIKKLVLYLSKKEMPLSEVNELFSCALKSLGIKA